MANKYHLNQRFQYTATTGMIWICPHVEVSHSELTVLCGPSKTLDPPEDLSRALWRVQRGTYDGERSQDVRTLECSACKVPVRLTGISKLHVSFPVLKVDLLDDEGERKVELGPRRKAILKRLQKYGAPFCPHLRLNSPEVLAAYDEHSRRLEDQDTPVHCSCMVCSQNRIECKHCHAAIAFEVQQVSRRSWLLSVAVTRDLKPTTNANDPQWLSQLAQRSEFEAYRRGWYDLERVCV